MVKRVPPPVPPAYSGDVIRGQIIQTSESTYEAPENIIQNLYGARSLYYIYRTEHLPRIQLYAQIEGLLAGNPPYDPLDLERNGLMHIANFNSLDAAALYDKGANAYFNLWNEVETLVKFEVRAADEQVLKWAHVMAKHWDTIIRAWPAFYTQANTLAGQLVKFGISPLIWSDERDWRWRTIELNKFLIPDQCLTDIEQLTVCFVETNYTAQYLWEIYQLYKDKRDETDWNLDEIGGLLINQANTYAKTYNIGTILDMMDLQKRIQNRDLTFNAIFSDNIPLVTCLCKEYDGKISHFMFHRVYDRAGYFLFRADRQYESMSQAVAIFTSSPEVFTIHSNRGLGHQLFSPCQAMMQLDCSIVDAARWASTPLIKTTATQPRDFEPIKFTPGVPSNIGMAEFVQNNMGANVEQLVAVSQYLLGKVQRNMANAGNDPSQPDADQGSLSPLQVRFNSYKEFSVLKNKIMHFYAQLDPVVEQMTIKMLNSKEGWPGYEQSERWKKMCIEDGVPELLFKGGTSTAMPNQLKVRASRVSGDGSTVALILGLQELAPDVSALPEKGQREYLRMKVKAVLGQEALPALLPDQTPDEVSGGASLAGVENAVMRAGEAPIFSIDNEHEAHLVTHIALATDTIQRLQQNESTPVEADKIFAQVVPHGSQHFQALVNNPYKKVFVDKVKKSWQQIVQYATLNRKNADAQLKAELRKRQQAQDKTQQVMSDAQRKDFTAQKDAQRADFKVASQVERAKEASANRAEIQREGVQSKAANDRLKIDLEARNKPLEDQSIEELRSQIATLNGVTPSPNDIEQP